MTNALLLGLILDLLQIYKVFFQSWTSLIHIQYFNIRVSVVTAVSTPQTYTS